ncbi:hypothetical protein [Streptomyces sp. NRRL S-118]|uniref:hypothetical protein n=1 Tax=Streptomyces sp. NRRL S-118 TaxID=1463881 RepID=UPI0004C9DFA4|nr:hypothetical protein [Streptomyces sp. NRRL S-118]
MTTADGWATAVRSRLGLGRLLPLGGAADGVWLAERAAAGVLRRTAWAVPGVSPGRLRIGLADPESAGAPVVPPPPGALPPGPLRIEADFAVRLAGSGSVPLPDTAELLRTALLRDAEERLGLQVTVADLRVTALLEAAAPGEGQAPEEAGGEEASGAARGAPGDALGPAAGADAGTGTGTGPAATTAAVVAAVPGVLRLTSVLGPSVHRGADHLRIELATAPGHRALDVALAVRAAVGGTLPVSVLVTDVAIGEP